MTKRNACIDFLNEKIDIFCNLVQRFAFGDEKPEVEEVEFAIKDVIAFANFALERGGITEEEAATSAPRVAQYCALFDEVYKYND